MTDTSKLPEVTPVTVRLTPSRATEPFGMMYRVMSGEAVTVRRMALSSRFSAASVPVPSMCPETMCPPRRLSRRRARSRFTREPACRLPSAVCCMVSGMASAVNASRSMEVTVRHTPLVAMLSPTAVPSRMPGAAMCSVMLRAPRRMERMVPMVSIIPVNMVILLD